MSRQFEDVFDSDGIIPFDIESYKPDVLRRVQLQVAERAHDSDDLKRLLEMMGLRV